jgi:lipopolysaccharide export system protein LptA
MSNAYTPLSCRTSSNSRAPSGARPELARACILLGLLALAPAVSALPEDADKPINIRADSVEYDQTGNRIIYRGSVQVDQGTLRVTAETMVIDLQDGKKVLRITAEDTPARYQQQIEVDEEPVRAEALTIIYHTQDERVDLRGAANLEQEGSTLTGDLIVYDIVAGRVDANATEETPVTMVLQPSAMEQSGEQPEANSSNDPALPAPPQPSASGDDGVER